MQPDAIATKITEHLRNKTYQLKSTLHIADIPNGNIVQPCILMQFLFKLGNPINGELIFNNAKTIFIQDKVTQVQLGDYDCLRQGLTVYVKYPLPYVEAELFLPKDRASFILRKASYDLSILLDPFEVRILKHYFPDPCYPKGLTFHYLKHLCRTFAEYLKQKLPNSNPRDFQEYIR